MPWKTMRRYHLGTLAIASLLSTITPRVQASVYINAPFANRVYDSVAYFQFQDTKWPFVESGDMLIGPISVLSATSFDQFFMEYQQSQEEIDAQKSNEKVDSMTSAPYVVSHTTDPTDEYLMTTPPSFLIVEFGSSPYSSSLVNIRHVATWINADFVVLVVNRNAPWQDKLRFWWNHKFPGIPHGELEKEGKIINEHGRCSFLAVGATEGAAMLNLLENYQSWDSIMTQEFCFGIDSVSTMAGRAFTWRVAVYVAVIVAFWTWTRQIDRRDMLAMQGGEEHVKYTGEELGMGEVQASCNQHECCVCLESMPQGEKVRILPCRHVFHHDCINGWFDQKKYSCPMCKMDLKKHLAERRIASEGMDTITTPRKSLRQRLWPWSGRNIGNLNSDQLIGDGETQEAVVEGDLELTEDVSSGVIV